MRLDVLNEFGFDQSEEDLTKIVATHIEGIEDNTIELDFSGCMLDYPATSIIIDSAISTLSKVSAPRKLVLDFNFPFQEILFVKWYFFGGSILPQELQNAELDVIRDHICSKIKKKNISIVMRHHDPKTGISVDKYIYE